MPVIADRRQRSLAGSNLLAGSQRGVEKESLRVTPDGYISKAPHPKALGSALTNRYITTDFSEALIEFITSPVAEVWEATQFLCDLHQFAYQYLGDEVLWAMSMPCMIRTESDIPLARYGDSNIGRMKTIYRRGLGYRYGRYMQAIAGLHYNFSLPGSLWPRLQEADENDELLEDYRSEAYLGLIRNVRRMDWLILYLFGASPAVCKSFLQGRVPGLQELDYGTLYGPYATTLRMSDVGYHNANQARLHVSANSLDEYISHLDKAIQTEHPGYRDIGVYVDDVYRQLNANQLQIENEYYSAIRPKRIARSGERPTAALRRGGVEYVELRSLDVNPFEPVGINQQQAHFVEVFLTYCLLLDSPPIGADEMHEHQHNDAVVARQGRQPGLRLIRKGAEIGLQDWGRHILDGMLDVCEFLDIDGGTAYADAVRQVGQAVDDPDLTPSARLLAELKQTQMPLFTYAMQLSRDYADYFRSLAPELNAHREILERESRESWQRQAEIERSDDVDFETFLQRYFA